MKSDRRTPVAIVGGGFSGTIVAAQLARRGIASLLIDGSGRLGRGVAYSTTEPAHLLNVRAEGMSAWAGEPEDFARRFEAKGGDARGFAERRLFGRYLDEILGAAKAAGLVATLNDTATRAAGQGGSWIIDLQGGERIHADALVLAIGNQPPEPLGRWSDLGARYIADPWGPASQQAAGDLARSGGSALLVGTGLTMVDVALSLDAAGFQGRAVALSRRGQVPRAHADFEPAPVTYEELPAGALSQLWYWLRRRSAEVGWRAAVDSLRPHSQRLWQSLSTDQQRRFMRHARPWWDVHRHRIAPQVAGTMAAMIADGRLQVVAGRVVSARPGESGLDVEIRNRGAADPRSFRFDYLFNCTGPLQAIARTQDPLLRSLLDGGQVRADHLGLGLDIDQRSRATPGERLWALGPLTKGRYWEIIAVPDIREQAAAVAADIAEELSNDHSV